MDYAEMNLGSWDSYLARFKNLLRPAGVDPLGDREEIVESVRSEESAAALIEKISGVLPNLVFESYFDWYGYDDEWVLRNLGHVMTGDEEYQILSGLDQGTADALKGVLSYIEGRLDPWGAVARQEFAGEAEEPGLLDGAAEEPGLLDGAANTANWEASRTPGTFYYTYTGDRYLYSDLEQAPLSEWETLPVRERDAAANAQPWGTSGWFYTPAGEPGLYGGAFVYAPDKDGPWMTAEQAEAAMAVAPEPAFTPWGAYWIKDVGDQRWYGATNPDGPWYRTPEEFTASLDPGTIEEARRQAADQVDAMLNTVFSEDFFEELRQRLQKASLSPTAITDLGPEDFASIIAQAFTPSA